MHSSSLVSDDWPKYEKSQHYLMLYKSRFFPGSCQILEKGGKSMITLPSPGHTSDVKCKVYSLNSSLPGSEYQNIWKSSRGSIEVNEGTIRFCRAQWSFLVPRLVQWSGDASSNETRQFQWGLIKPNSQAHESLETEDGPGQHEQNKCWIEILLVRGRGFMRGQLFCWRIFVR